MDVKGTMTIDITSLHLVCCINNFTMSNTTFCYGETDFFDIVLTLESVRVEERKRGTESCL